MRVGEVILIHTSVKLVTVLSFFYIVPSVILIHTSVKLVTYPIPHQQLFRLHFNPHEREARDLARSFPPLSGPILIHTSVKLVTLCAYTRPLRSGNFNPHEREARDRQSLRKRLARHNFNPHEREARDQRHPFKL